MSIVLPALDQPASTSADVRSRSCMRGGSPVSNRSVSFATCDELSTNSSVTTTASKKSGKSKKRRRDSDKSDKISQKSFDSSLSNATYETAIGRRPEAVKPRTHLEYLESASSTSRNSIAGGGDHIKTHRPLSIVSLTEVDTGNKLSQSTATSGDQWPGLVTRNNNSAILTTTNSDECSSGATIVI